MAEYDELTGLLSMKGYLNAVRKYLTLSPEKQHVLIFFDICAFRDYNHKYGFHEGDDLLLQFAEELRKIFPGDYITRLSADQFSVLTGSQDVSDKIEHLHIFVHALQKNVSLELKAGIYLQNGPSDTNVSLMIDHARLAARSIHDQYDHNIAIYNDDIAEREELKRYILNHFNEALECGYIETWYQPVIRTLSGRICGFEALCRWNDPINGILSPALFIGVLEDAHLISRLDLRMVENVCRDLKTAESGGRPVVPISINLSRNDFLGADAFNEVNSIVTQSGISPELINIEITESTLEAEPEYLRHQISRFQEAGYEIWIDDFGSRYSTLGTLKDFNFDVLKIDQTFVRGMESNQKARTLVASVVNMAKHLGIHTLCEGVETREQIEFLNTIGCEQLQGFYYSKPLPIMEIRKLISKFGLESPQKARCYKAIGEINMMSDSPLESGRSYDSGSRVPLMLVKADQKGTRLLYHNTAMDEMAESLNLRDSEDFLQYFMSVSTYRSIILHAITHPGNTQESNSLDLVISNKFCSISFRTIASKTDSYAYLAFTGLILDSSSAITRSIHINDGIRHMLTIFNRIDLFNLDAGTAENIYLNTAQDRLTDFCDTSKETIAAYAEKYLDEEDRSSFIEFYDMDKLNTRIPDRNASYITAFFRSHDKTSRQHLQSYTLIPFSTNGARMVLSCISDIGNTIYNKAFQEQLIRNASIGPDRINESMADLLTSFLGIVQVNAAEDSYTLIYRNWDSAFRTHRTFTQACENFCKNNVHPDDRERYLAFMDRRTWMERAAENNLHEFSESFRIKNGSGGYSWLIHNIIQNGHDAAVFTVAVQWTGSSSQEKMLDFWYSQGRDLQMQIDPVTGLLDRRGIDQKLLRYIRSYPSAPGVLINLNIDNFKIINDILGRDIGDRTLCRVADALRQNFDDGDIIGRNAADEFIVFMKDSSLTEASSIVNRLVSSPMTVDFHGESYRFFLSAGLVEYPKQGSKPGTLCRKANAALCSAKQSEGHCYRVYNSDICTENRTHLQKSITNLASDLPKAVLVYKMADDLQILYASEYLLRLCECDSIDEFNEYSKSSFLSILCPEDRDKTRERIRKYYAEHGDPSDIRESLPDYLAFCQKYRIKTRKGRIRTIRDSCRLVHSVYYGDIFYVFLDDADTIPDLPC